MEPTQDTISAAADVTPPVVPQPAPFVASPSERFAAAVKAEEIAFRAMESGSQLERADHFTALRELAGAWDETKSDAK